MANQTLGQDFGQGMQDAGKTILQALLSMNNQNSSPVAMGANALSGAAQGFQNTPQGGDVLKEMMGTAAKKVLMNSFTDHAENLLQTHPDGANILASFVPKGGEINPNAGASGSWGSPEAMNKDASSMTGMAQENGGVNPVNPGGFSTMNPATGMAIGVDPATFKQPGQPITPPNQQQGLLQVIGSLLGANNGQNGQRYGLAGILDTPEDALTRSQTNLTRQQAINASPGGALALKNAENSANLSTEQKATLGASGWKAQADLIDKSNEDIAKGELAAKNNLQAALDARGAISKHYTATQALEDYKKQMNAYSLQRQANTVKQFSLYGQHPNLKISKGSSQNIPFQPNEIVAELKRRGVK